MLRVVSAVKGLFCWKSLASEHCRFRFEKMQLRRHGDQVAFVGVTVEKVQTFEAGVIQIVVDVFGEVFDNGSACHPKSSRPRFRNGGKIVWLKTMIAGTLEDCGEVRRRLFRRCPSHCPECKHEWLACEMDPFFGEVPGWIL